MNCPPSSKTKALQANWRSAYGVPTAIAVSIARARLSICAGSIGLYASIQNSGIVRAEAGVSLSDLLRLVVPKGWFVSTTPGTRFVTLGGALANDVHGKNHHSAGSFGRNVRSFGLLRSDRGPVTVAPESEPALFSSTVGGLGLTGVVEWIELQLVRIGGAYLDVETIPYDRLDAFWELAEESVNSYEHTVAWIDCTSRGDNSGRGIFSRANWIADGVYDVHDDRSWKRIPLEAPGIALNRLTVSAFNEVYHRLNSAKAGKNRQHYAPFFYPLDAVRDWNRFYGRRGMLQYQCVIPRANQRDAVKALLDVITASGQASFLAVLKTFGDLPSPGLLSFARPGATLALDFPFPRKRDFETDGRSRCDRRGGSRRALSSQGRTNASRNVQALIPQMGATRNGPGNEFGFLA